jgi:hypothetical protein
MATMRSAGAAAAAGAGAAACGGGGGGGAAGGCGCTHPNSKPDTSSTALLPFIALSPWHEDQFLKAGFIPAGYRNPGVETSHAKYENATASN